MEHQAGLLVNGFVEALLRNSGSLFVHFLKKKLVGGRNLIEKNW